MLSGKKTQKQPFSKLSSSSTKKTIIETKDQSPITELKVIEKSKQPRSEIEEDQPPMLPPMLGPSRPLSKDADINNNKRHKTMPTVQATKALIKTPIRVKSKGQINGSERHDGADRAGERSGAQKVKVDTGKLSKQVSEVAPLFQSFFQQNYLEIEAKLGKWQNNQFVSGTSRDDFLKIHDMLCGYKGWIEPSTPTTPPTPGRVLPPTTSSKNWVPTFDYMLENSIRVTKSSNGNVFVRKTTMKNVTFSTNKKYDLRVSLKEEMPVQIMLPKEPHLVRVKKRKSFNYKNTWQFDLTMVWTGANEQDAQSNQPTYEVECEYIGSRLNGPPNQDYNYLAGSLLEKMIDFLGRDGNVHLEKV